MRRFSSGQRRTIASVAFLVAFFVGAMLTRPEDVGPDWLAPRALPGLPAMLVGLLVGTATAAAVVVLAGFTQREGRRRRDRPKR